MVIRGGGVGEFVGILAAVGDSSVKGSVAERQEADLDGVPEGVPEGMSEGVPEGVREGVPEAGQEGWRNVVRGEVHEGT